MQTGAYMASAMVGSPNRKGPSEALSWSRQTVAMRSMSDWAPVCTRFSTYDVALDPVCAAYRDHILALPLMREWTLAALEEPDEVEELDVEF